MKPVKRETNRPPQNLPYRDINQPFRFQFVIPGNGIMIEQDANGICYISTSGVSPDELVAGDNIEITRKDGKVVISAVNSVTNITAGDNVNVTVDPDTGDVVISSVVGGDVNEHYQGVFNTTDELIAFDTKPENGDYGLVKNLTYSDAGETWGGSFKYCFYINGQWTVVDQMLTFTDNLELLKQYYSVGGSSPTIYLHTVAKTGSFRDLNDKPVVDTPEASVQNGSVVLSCATPGAEIFYTLDGSTPYPWGDNAYKYTAPVSLPENGSVRAVAVKNGMINSEECYYVYGTGYQKPTVVIDHHTGVVTISNPNTGATNPLLVYTVNGVENSSGEMTVSFLLENRADITAQATDTNPQPLYSGLTEVTFEKVKTPRMMFGTTYNYRPDDGAFVCTCDTPDSEMHYTDDGSTTPDWESPVTTGTIRYDHIYVDRHIKVMAIAENMVPSDVFNGEWGLGDPDAPVITYDPDTMLVTIDRRGHSADHFGNTLGLDDWNYEIRYTTDGSTPTPQSSLYTGPFTPPVSGTVKAYLIAYGAYYSAVSSQAVTVLEAPSSTLEYTTGMVALHNPNGRGTIHYTLDGSTPTAESPAYVDAFMLTENTTIKMIVVQGSGVSAVATKTYTQAEKPMYYNTDTNLLTGTTDMAFLSNTPGAELHYTVDGSTPSYLSALYTAPVRFNIFGGEGFKVLAIAPGYIPSAISTGDFGSDPDSPDIIIDGGSLTFALAGNTIGLPLQTNNNTPDLGVRIYYTLDGSTPSSSNGVLWDGNPVKYSGEDVKALTVCYGQYNSDVSSYTNIEPLYLAYGEAYGSQTNRTVKMTSSMDAAPDIEYSAGDKSSWTPLAFTGSAGNWTSESIPFEEQGDIVYFRGTNAALSNALQSKYTKFVVAGAKAFAGGTVQSLVDGKGESETAIEMASLFDGCPITSSPMLPATTLVAHCYENMFRNCAFLQVIPSALPATLVQDSCYKGMFSGCTSLTYGPELPSGRTAISCYEAMFKGCTSLVDEPSLPATGTLYPYCYKEMFSGCTSLSSAPTLPATRMAEECYQSMFANCRSLRTAPALPAENLAVECYREMFGGCTALQSAPALPATTMAVRCYTSMFSGCTSLSSAPTLPAMTMAEQCYQSMFDGCTSLVSAPALPATTLATYCYESMFHECSLLVSAPALPATTLASYCYANMFAGCTGLLTPSVIGATTLAQNCCDSMYTECGALQYAEIPAATALVSECYSNMFNSCLNLMDIRVGGYTISQFPFTALASRCCQFMFWGCGNLQSAPDLDATVMADSCYTYMFSATGIYTAPAIAATTLAQECFSFMFDSCYNLQAGPELHAATPVGGAYNSMFSNCPNLTLAFCGFTTWNPDIQPMTDWLYGAGSSGELYAKDPSCVDYQQTPPDWTVQQWT